MPATPAKPKRKDPTPRRVHHGFDLTVLAEKDPNRVYRFASKTSEHMGVGEMEQLGWRIEKQGDGVKLRAGVTAQPGEPIELKGCVLMSIEKDVHDTAIEEGWYGEGGQNELDRIEARIRKSGSVMDPREFRVPDGLALKNMANQPNFME